MKKYTFPLLFGLLALCLIGPFAPQRAEALSEMSRQRLMSANPDFAFVETALDQVWEKLARTLPRPAVEPYLESLLQWRNQGRDEAVRTVYANWLANPTILPPALLDEQGLPSLSAVYAKVTRERAKLMDMAAKQFKDDKLASSIPGWIDRFGEPGQPDTYYTLTPYGWVTSLRIGSEKELAGLPTAVRESIIALPDNDYDTLTIVKGRLDDRLSGFNLRAGLTLEKPADKGWLEWDPRAAAPDEGEGKEVE